MPSVLQLASLCLQALAPLAIRWTWTHGSAGSPYHSMIVVLVAEGLKLVLSFVISTRIRKDNCDMLRRPQKAAGRLLASCRESRFLALPAVLSVTANAACMFALGNMRASIFTALMNVSLIFAALLSVCVLGHRSFLQQWRVLLLIASTVSVLLFEHVEAASNPIRNEMVSGVVLTLTAAAAIAAAGVLIEKRFLGRLLPATDECPSLVGVAIWEQQAVLAVFSTTFAFVLTVAFYQTAPIDGTPLRGFSPAGFACCCLMAVQDMVSVTIIQQSGIVRRMLLGTGSVALCVILEAAVFESPLGVSEIMTIAVLVLGLSFYSTDTASKPCAATGGEMEAACGLSAAPSRCSTEDFMLPCVPLPTCSEHVQRHTDAVSKPRIPSTSSRSSSPTAWRRLGGVVVAFMVCLSFSSTFTTMIVDSVFHASKQSELADIARYELASSNPSARQVKAQELSVQSPKTRRNTDVEEVPAQSPPSADQHQELDTTELRKTLFEQFRTDLADSDNVLLKAAGVTLQRPECDLEAAKSSSTWDRAAGPKRDIAVCVQIRNDARILDEYIAFHWVQGVAKFVIYDDASEDRPYDVLQKYVGLGIVEYHDMRGHPGTGGNELQTDNLNTCFTDMRKRYQQDGLRWILFPDIDEFHLPQDGTKTLTEVLNEEFDEAACIQVGRTWFGSSYQHKRPVGLVTENYLLASPVGVDGYPKMVANIIPRNAQRNATALYTVHNFVDQADIPCRWKAESTAIRINHYVRSLEDYETKMLTGHKALNRYSRPLDLWWERDRNDRYDPSAAGYACRVKGHLALVRELWDNGKIPRVPPPPSSYANRTTGQ